ncbi:MAG TPA: ABC transporter ATP-binding protein [Acidimicrobiia bacterium]
MALLEVRGLRKEFGDVVAVDGVDIKSEEGEFLVLLGPSGCGKTTLLRMIAGLEHPTDGQILLGGEDVTDLPPRARRIAMVFQSYALYPHMTVARNIAFPLKAQGVEPEKRDEKVKWAAELFGIEHLLNRRPRQLSGGERQRVALARAIVREPSVFLLDEPLSNLDAKLRAAARDDLLGFQRQIGITTVYVTHDQVEAMGMGDRIAVMEKGRVRQIGTPEEVYHHPADTFVAQFIGSPPMNLFQTKDHVFGFRPETFLPDGVAEQDDRVPFDFFVNRVEYLGSERYLYGHINGFEDTKVIAMLPATVRVPLEEQKMHKFTVASADLRFFDKETGLKIPPQPITS